MIRRFARPYAKAFLEIARSTEERMQLLEALRSFEKVRKENAELSQLFANPAVDADRKEKVVGAIAAKLGLDAIATRVLNVLVRNGRINGLEWIILAFRSAINETTGTEIAKVRTAHALSDQERNTLQQGLEKRFGGRIDLELEVDASLIGGFVAEVGSEVYDASVVGQISKLRQQLA